LLRTSSPDVCPGVCDVSDDAPGPATCVLHRTFVLLWRFLCTKGLDSLSCSGVMRCHTGMYKSTSLPHYTPFHLTGSQSGIASKAGRAALVFIQHESHVCAPLRRASSCPASRARVQLAYGARGSRARRVRDNECDDDSHQQARSTRLDKICDTVVLWSRAKCDENAARDETGILSYLRGPCNKICCECSLVDAIDGTRHFSVHLACLDLRKYMHAGVRCCVPLAKVYG
jgi:hypothetical protein